MTDALGDVLADTVALAAVFALLVTAILHLPWRQEAAASLFVGVGTLALLAR